MKKFTRQLSSLTRVVNFTNSSEVKAAIYSLPQSPDQHSISVFTILQNNSVKRFSLPAKSATLEEAKLASIITSALELPLNPNNETTATEFDLDSWYNFIKNLNPTIAAILGLDISRHKISLYNYCLTRRSYENDQDSQRATRNRSKAVAIFPLFIQIIKDDEYRASILLDKFERGASAEPTKHLAEHLKIRYPTTGLLKRISNAPSLRMVKVLDELLHTLPSSQNQNSRQSYLNRVSDLPLPNRPDEYAAMWKILSILDRCKLSTRAKVQIFFNAKGNWLENANSISENFPDLIKKFSQNIAKDLLLPHYLKRLHEKISESFLLPQDSAQISDNLKRFNGWLTTYITSNLSDFVEEKMFANLSPKNIAEYASRLDRMTGKINQSKSIFCERARILKESGQEFPSEWHRCFSDQEINGIKFRVLTSDAELQIESAEVHNCTSSLGQKCNLGECHVLSGITPSGERFSVRLDRWVSGKVVLNEVNGVSNQGISKEVSEATKILQQRIESGEIALNSKVGSTSNNFTINDSLGFRLENEEDVRSVFEAYRQANILPNGLMDSLASREEFYQETGFEKFLDSTLVRDVAISTRETPPPSISSKCILPLERRRGPREISILDG